MKRRDATRVICDILRITGDGVAKTQILYKANLNSKLTKSYLDFLASKGYVEKHTIDSKGSTVYNLTEEGKRLLNELQHVESRLQGLFS